MNVLVTGANGFVGRAVVRRLAQLGMKVRGAMRKAVPVEGCEPVAVDDIGAHTDWRDAIAGIDVVVHLAARVHVMRETAADPLAAFRAVNVAGTLALATAAKAAGVRRRISEIDPACPQWCWRCASSSWPRPRAAAAAPRGPRPARSCRIPAWPVTISH
jgi:uncharacterized protein YbjT (DUF2867 family)